MRSILIIETSLQGALIGIAKESGSTTSSNWQLVSHRHYENPQAASASLPRLVLETLRANELSIENLSALVVGVGPGSFTGIKIGLSFAYGLKRSSASLPLWGSSALKALSSDEKDKLWVLPATQSSGYFAHGAKCGVVQEYPNGSGQFQIQGGPHDWPKPIHVLGEWPKFRAFCEGMSLVLKEEAVESLSRLILMGMLQDFIANSQRVSDGLPEPLYLRKSAPEEKLEQTALGVK